MADRITGPGLFFGAIGDLIAHPGATLRIAAVPLAVFLAIEARSARAYVQWWIEGVSYTPPPEVGSTIAFYVLVGVLAVGWHRVMILGQPPAIIFPLSRLGILFRYTIGWIVIGIIVGLAVVVLIGVPAFLLGSLANPDFGVLMVEIFAPTGTVAAADITGLSLVMAGGCVGLGMYAYLYGIFRCSMGLPAVAVDAEERLGLRASWARTRILARPIAGVAGFAMVALVVMLGGHYLIYWAPLEEGVTFQVEFLRRIMAAVLDTLNTLIGAAILTRIYRATQAEFRAPPPV